MCRDMAIRDETDYNVFYSCLLILFNIQNFIISNNSINEYLSHYSKIYNLNGMGMLFSYFKISKAFSL